MLDPLTALGVASNVISVVDFSGKIISGAINIYGSVDGTSKDNVSLEDVTADLSKMSEKLAHDMKALTLSTGVAAAQLSGPAAAAKVHQDALYQLASRGKQLADDLIQTLQKLKVKGDRFKVFKSSLAAVKISLKSEDISRCRRSLEDVRSQMTARMVALISEHQRDMFEHLRRQSEDRLRSENTIKMSTDKLESNMISVMTHLSAAPDKTDFAQLLTQINALAGEWKRTTALLKTINSLSFESIDARWVAVEHAYSKTFEWALGDDVDAKPKFPILRNWLQGGSDIFWITGKPGSGKSTFMKFLFSDSRTEQLLQTWAGQHELMRASHFFWAAGTPMQKSLLGLLQSLLNELLQKCPKLAEAIVSRDRLDAPPHSSASWTIPELRDCFSRLKTQTEIGLRICFFVDGLDEYDGDHEEILEIFEDLAKNDNIKFCLASRDWNVFLDWFKGRGMLRLEDLTRSDICHFAQSKLEEDRRFAILRQENSAYDDVVELIVNEAEGVFLWVYLVVQSLKRGFIEGDTIKDLMRRIKSLPKKLEDFFLNMLDSVEEVYHVESAEILQICQATSGSLPLITVSFFDEDDHLFGTHCRVNKRLTLEEVQQRCMSTQRRVRARCRDLVMFTKTHLPADYWRLEFVHRTAKDFVQSAHVQNLLKTRVRKNFIALRYLCQAEIVQAKLMPRDDNKKGTLDEFPYYAVRALQLSENYEKLSEKSDLESMIWLDEMNETLENEGVLGPDTYKKTEPEEGFRNTWLFNNAVRHSFSMYQKHCIDPFVNTDKWNLRLGPKFVKNLTAGAVRATAIARLESAFFLFSLGSMRGETIVDDSDDWNWKWESNKPSLCYLVFQVLVEDLWWTKDEHFCLVARQFIDELLRRTDMDKLNSSLGVVGFCRTIQSQGFSSAGLTSFLGEVDRAKALAKTSAKESLDNEESDEDVQDFRCRRPIYGFFGLPAKDSITFLGNVDGRNAETKESSDEEELDDEDSDEGDLNEEEWDKEEQAPPRLPFKSRNYRQRLHAPQKIVSTPKQVETFMKSMNLDE